MFEPSSLFNASVFRQNKLSLSERELCFINCIFNLYNQQRQIVSIFYESDKINEAGVFDIVS